MTPYLLEGSGTGGTHEKNNLEKKGISGKRLGLSHQLKKNTKTKKKKNTTTTRKHQQTRPS